MRAPPLHDTGLDGGYGIGDAAGPDGVVTLAEQDWAKRTNEVFSVIGYITCGLG